MSEDDKMALKNEMLSKISNLCNGSETRNSVAEWAFSIIENDELYNIDKKMYGILEGLGAVDLIDPTVDDGYIYNIDDFLEWGKLLINLDS